MFKNLYATKIENGHWVSLILRIIGGAFMLTHGIPKLLKIIEGNIEFGDPIGLSTGTSLFLAVFAEFFCALMILLGFAMRLAALPLMINMFVAAFVVHTSDPFERKELAFVYFDLYGSISIGKWEVFHR